MVQVSDRFGSDACASTIKRIRTRCGKGGRNRFEQRVEGDRKTDYIRGNAWLTPGASCVPNGANGTRVREMGFDFWVNCEGPQFGSGGGLLNCDAADRSAGYGVVGHTYVTEGRGRRGEDWNPHASEQK